MQAPVRHPSPLDLSSCGADSHPTTAPPIYTSFRHPRPSTIPRRPHGATFLAHQNVRPLHGRVAAPRQVGVAPAPNSSYKGTALITTRGNMRGGGGDRSFPLISPARQSGGGWHAARVPNRETLFVSGGLGRGVRPMVRHFKGESQGNRFLEVGVVVLSSLLVSPLIRSCAVRPGPRLHQCSRNSESTREKKAIPRVRNTLIAR